MTYVVSPNPATRAQVLEKYRQAILYKDERTGRKHWCHEAWCKRHWVGVIRALRAAQRETT